MPASVLGDMDIGMHHHPGSTGNGVLGAGLEDQKALRLALELSMLNFGSSDHAVDNHHHHHHHHQQQLHQQQHHHHANGMSLANYHDQLLAAAGNGVCVGSDSPFTSAFSLDSPDDMRILPTKRSQNMTECVPVPSSEHVAEIVGRQGCKIKALRAKTNTYIKTPVRGEEPVFVVTGRKEDVALAKREILSAAEHFSQIRASRKGGVTNGLSCAPTPVPGQITIQVTVPYRVVGLVVGPKGATIKRIQQTTHTYIVTPSREKDPVFEVTGLPDNVQQAKREIEAHIAFRTGTLPIGEPLPDDFGQNGLLESIYKNGVDNFPFDGLCSLNLNLEELGLDFNLGGIGLGTINSLSSSLSSVSGLSHGGGAFETGGSSGKTGSVGSSTNGGGSWSSLSDLTSGFSSSHSNNLLPAASTAAVSATTTSTVTTNGWSHFD